jgi:hypothetical protein
MADHLDNYLQTGDEVRNRKCNEGHRIAGVTPICLPPSDRNRDRFGCCPQSCHFWHACAARAPSDCSLVAVIQPRAVPMSRQCASCGLLHESSSQPWIQTSSRFGKENPRLFIPPAWEPVRRMTERGSAVPGRGLADRDPQFQRLAGHAPKLA